MALPTSAWSALRSSPCRFSFIYQQTRTVKIAPPPSVVKQVALNRRRKQLAQSTRSPSDVRQPQIKDAFEGYIDPSSTPSRRRSRRSGNSFADAPPPATSTTPSPTDETASTSSPPAPPQSTPAHSPLTSGPLSALQLPYHIPRTPSGEFPVYTTTRRGGNLYLTQVKKVQGNIEALRARLQAHFRLEDAHCAISAVSKVIVLKGHRKVQVMEFLSAQGL